MGTGELTAVVGGTVIDGTGRDPVDDAVVLIADGRVQSVIPADATSAPTVPESARRIDATGRHVIPGLMDANVHLSYMYPDVILEYEGRYDEIVEEAAQVALRSGVTTVFDTYGHLDALVAVRDRINRGEVAGSRIYVAGNIIGLDGPFSRDFFAPGNLLGPDTLGRLNPQWEQGVGADLMWLTTDGVRRRVRDYIERSDIDFVKYAASGHAGLRQFITFSERTQRAIVEEAHRAGLLVQAHTTTVESLRMEIEAGADLLQHGNFTGLEPIPEAILDIIVERRLPVAAIFHTKRYRAWIQEQRNELLKVVFGSVQNDNDQRLIDAGARLLLTTDGMVVGPRMARHPGFFLHDAVDMPLELGEAHVLWLESAVERGMAPMDALVAATRGVAEGYGRADDLGTLEPGKRADLVILDGDPLADVQNYGKVAEVVKDGVLIDRAALPRRRILTAPPADGPR
jgi:imidazolonepropionase-like amidohydrolase